MNGHSRIAASDDRSAAPLSPQRDWPPAMIRHLPVLTLTSRGLLGQRRGVELATSAINGDHHSDQEGNATDTGHDTLPGRVLS
jgi:hypothetical protein